MSLWPRNGFTFLFSLQTISGSDVQKREIEREKEERTAHSTCSHRSKKISPIISLIHTRRAQPLDPLPHGSLITELHPLFVQCQTQTQGEFSFSGWLFLSPTAFVYGFNHFTPPIHTPHLTSPPIHTPPTAPHLRSTHLRPHLTSDLHTSDLTSPHLRSHLTSNPHTSDPHKSDPHPLKLRYAKIHPQTHKQPILQPTSRIQSINK